MLNNNYFKRNYLLTLKPLSMKKVILISFILLTSTVHSQNYLAFPDSNARWVNERYVSSYEIYYSRFCMNGEDTTINTFTYTKVNTCSANSLSDAYYGALRDAAGKVYLVPKDSSNEYLVYDFTANLGDTIENVYTNGYSQDVRVKWIDTININGVDHRRLFVSEDDFSGPFAPGPIYWVEGVGNSQGLFGNNFLPLSSDVYSLHCMSHSGSSVSMDGAWSNYSTSLGDCDLTVSLEEANDNQATSFSIFPNPAKNSLSLSVPGKVEQVFIYDSKGALVQQEISGQFSVSQLESGIHFIRVISNEGVHFQRFVKD